MENNGYRAVSKFLQISPTKMRYIANEVRSKSYTDAMAILESLPNKGAKLISKVIKSAASNAISRNKQLDEEMLYVKELRIDEGPRMKRVWQRSRGRRDILLKRMSHISVIIDEIVTKKVGK